MAKSSGITHAISNSGHRQSYQNLLAGLFGLSNVIAPTSKKQFFKLIRTKKLLISTIDDAIFWYSAIIIIRFILKKDTVAIFMRPQSCFYSGKIIFKLKYLLFLLLKIIPGSSIVTITPFHYRKKYMEIANQSVFDPQYWDYIKSNHMPVLGQSLLANQLQVAARGRPVLLFSGTVSKEKGIEFLADIVEQYPAIDNDVLIIVAGPIDKELEERCKRLQANGVGLVSRWLSDRELESLYGISSLIWACYHPSYDQASGIFGRAAQFNKTCLIRRGALLEEIGADMALNSVSLTYGDTAGAVQKIKQAADESLSRPRSLYVNPALVAARDQFVRSINLALRGSTP